MTYGREMRDTKKTVREMVNTIVCTGKFFTDISDCIGQYWTYYDTDTELMIV